MAPTIRPASRPSCFTRRRRLLWATTTTTAALTAVLYMTPGVVAGGALHVEQQQQLLNSHPVDMPSSLTSGLAILGGLGQLAYAGTAQSCPADSPQSCQNSSSVADTCCFNSPGGLLLQTQFWDTNPSTGPATSWTVHGLWPDNCDGTYESNCDSSRAYTNITQILQQYGKTDLLNYMNTYWVSDQGSNEDFWEHEWGKHGTCISTYDPSCYSGYTAGEEAADFFQNTVDLYKGLDTYKILSDAGITPSSSQTYAASDVQAALKQARGVNAVIRCTSGVLNEVWYAFNWKGSVQSGTPVPVEPSGTGSSCSGNIKYPPKSGGGSTTTTTATGTKTATPTSTGGAFAGKGYLNVLVNGKSNGCLISSGNWYTSGTCATYTAAAASGGGFTLQSSKGACAFGSSFACASGTSAGAFTASGSNLVYNGQSTFYASSVPSGSTQAPVYLSKQSQAVTIQWQAV